MFDYPAHPYSPVLLQTQYRNWYMWIYISLSSVTCIPCGNEWSSALIKTVGSATYKRVVRQTAMSAGCSFESRLFWDANLMCGDCTGSRRQRAVVVRLEDSIAFPTDMFDIQCRSVWPFRWRIHNDDNSLVHPKLLAILSNVQQVVVSIVFEWATRTYTFGPAGTTLHCCRVWAKGMFTTVCTQW